MSGAREVVLDRIRAALRDVPPQERPEDVSVAREYRRADRRETSELVPLLVDRLLEYRAQARQLPEAELGGALDQACAELGLGRVGVPAGLPEAWRPRGVELVVDDGLTATELDGLDGVLTGCALAIAETGTVALDGSPACGRRALTLVPDHHICIVRASQVVGGVPDGVAGLARAAASGEPITLISGPSATSDIELSRVEGVHGPRHLVVFVVG
jgi:L-lactate dehydrogenase complex protein LldG